MNYVTKIVKGYSVECSWNDLKITFSLVGGKVRKTSVACRSHVLDGDKLYVPPEVKQKMYAQACAILLKKKGVVPKSQLQLEFNQPCVHKTQEFIDDELSGEFCEVGGTLCNPCNAEGENYVE